MEVITRISHTSSCKLDVYDIHICRLKRGNDFPKTERFSTLYALYGLDTVERQHWWCSVHSKNVCNLWFRVSE